MRNTETYAEISEVVRLYVEGMCQNDAHKLRMVMHERMACIGHFDGGLEWDKRDGFIAAVDKAVDVPDPSPWYEINSISVAGDVATVQVEDIWLGMHFDDSLTLLKHEGRWVIVSKVFYLRAGGGASG
jgi:hypothetical protein